MDSVQIIGRTSSHFTRVTQIFALELGVPYELLPIFDMTQTDSSAYADNPALKMPTLKVGRSLIFGTENICRKLADIAGSHQRVVWPEQLQEDVLRNAQELIWHGMAVQVQLILGILVGKLPADNPYFSKANQGFQGSLRWLDEHLARVLPALPVSRHISLLEVTLFCLMEHLVFRKTVPIEAYSALIQFKNEFAKRESAQRTVYKMDKPDR